MEHENLDDLVIIDDRKWYQKLKDYPASYYLIAVNIITFLLLHISNLIEPNLWLYTFEKITANIAIEHEYYRLFTAIFTHEAVMHLFFNCMAIYILAQPIEYYFGKKKFVIIFIISGLFGSLSSFIFSPYPAIGASGGVFGIFGVHLYLYLKYKAGYLKAFGKNMLELLIINVVIGFVLPNIDYWGHFGGIAGGFLATYMLGVGKDIKINKTFIKTGILTLLIFVLALFYFSDVYADYAALLDHQIDLANEAIQKNDLASLKAVRERIEDEKPFLPPIPIESITDQMDYYIKNME